MKMVSLISFHVEPTADDDDFDLIDQLNTELHEDDLDGEQPEITKVDLTHIKDIANHLREIGMVLRRARVCVPQESIE